MKQLIVAVGLSALFAWWLTPGWWNFGFGAIGVILWFFVMWQYPIIRKNWYLQILALSNLLLMLLMWQRNNGAIKVMSFWGWGISLGTILAIATEPKEIITWKRVWNTFLQGVGYLFTGWVSIITFGKRFGSVITGLLLALPLLLLFGWLFYTADPTFAMLIDQSGFFKVKINDLFWTNLFVTFVFFSGIYSLLRTKLVKTVVVVSKEKWQTEAKIITSLVAGLFFVFGVIQIRYLVTPLAVLQKAGITLSEFTKRGYTEMLIASVLAFTMIIILENWTHKQGSRKLRIFFVGEIIWLIVSATRRNYLYQSSFGLTQARIVGAFLSLWLLIAAFLYIKKIASKLDNGWLIKYFVLASCWVLILLNAINSERIIAVNRPPTLGYGIDYQYLAQSSADGYEGWEKSLSFVEKEIASKKMMYIDEYIVADSVVNSLTSKYAYELGPQAEHYWHNYGSWNMSSKLARRYLLDNWQRLLTAQKELSIIGKQFN